MHRTVFFLLLAAVFLGLSWEREVVLTRTPAPAIWERVSKPRPNQDPRTKRPERGHTCICPVGMHWNNRKRKCVRYKRVISGIRGSNGQVSCPPPWKSEKDYCVVSSIEVPSCPSRQMYDREKKACVEWLIEHIANETTTESPKNKKETV